MKFYSYNNFIQLDNFFIICSSLSLYDICFISSDIV